MFRAARPANHGGVGERVEEAGLTVGADERVRSRLDRCVGVLGRMVAEGWFDGHEDSVGMEVELDLIDPLGRPRLVNEAVLAGLGRADFQYELGRFNLEVNLPPPNLRSRGVATSTWGIGGRRYVPARLRNSGSYDGHAHIRCPRQAGQPAARRPGGGRGSRPTGGGRRWPDGRLTGRRQPYERYFSRR